MSGLEPVKVECHSGHRYGERPLAFTWKGERVEVAAVVREWRSRGSLPDGRVGHHFRVRTVDGRGAELVYDEADDVWYLRGRDKGDETGRGIELA